MSKDFLYLPSPRKFQIFILLILKGWRADTMSYQSFLETLSPRSDVASFETSEP